MAYIGQGAGVGFAADATVTNLTVTGTVDFDATGNIDGAVIGATTPAAGTFTTLTAASLDYPTSDGTAGQVIATDGAGTLSFTSSVGGKFASYAILCDQKASGTGGGTFTSGAWRTRDLNTEITDPDGIVSISSNQFTLQAGSYLIRWRAPGYYINYHQTRLQNITDTSSFLGTIAYTSNFLADGIVTDSVGSARVTIGSAKVFEIQHQAFSTKTNNGFGLHSPFDTGIFTIVEIFKET